VILYDEPAIAITEPRSTSRRKLCGPKSGHFPIDDAGNGSSAWIEKNVCHAEVRVSKAKGLYIPI